jgi:signal transduction histidine kinase
MSVYREPGRRRARAAVVAGIFSLLAGGLAGFLIGRASEDEPSLAQQLAELQERVRPVLNALELVTIEYPEAVRNGDVVAETEYGAAASQAETAAVTVSGAREDLEAISPAETARLERALEDLQELIEERAEPAEVERAAASAERALGAAAGIER